MEASRELDRFRDPIAEWADDLSAAHDKRLALHTRARAMGTRAATASGASSRGAAGASIDALAPVDIKAITGYLSELRKWDQAAGKIGSEGVLLRRRARATRSSSCWPRSASRSRRWRLAEKKAARALRAFNLADRVFDAYQTKQKEDLAELLKQISHRVAQIYASASPGRGPR